MEAAKISVSEFGEFKRRRRQFAALTAYDFPTTRRLDRLGIPLILVGDSLGMVALGYEVGFTPSTFVFLAAGFMLLHGTSRWKFDVPLAAAMALGGYVVFIVLFDTRFPKGPFETWMLPFETWFTTFIEKAFL